MKIEVNLSSTQSAFNFPKEHCAILKLLMAQDPPPWKTLSRTVSLTVPTSSNSLQPKEPRENVPAGKKGDNTRDELKPEIKLELIAPTSVLAMVTTASRQIKLFEIRVPIKIHIKIKEILTRLGNKATLPEGSCVIPYGLTHQSVDAHVHKQMICMQNNVLLNFRIILLFGLLPSIP